MIQLTKDEQAQLEPLFERCAGFVAGVTAALEDVKRKAVEEVLTGRKQSQEGPEDEPHGKS